MKIFKMIRGFFVKWDRSSEIMQNAIFHVEIWSLTLRICLLIRPQPQGSIK